MAIRCAVLMTLDVAEAQPEFEQTMRAAVEKLRDQLGWTLPEHRPLITLTFDTEDMALLTQLESLIAERHNPASDIKREDRLANGDYLPEDRPWA
jgi:hypothetical protein